MDQPDLAALYGEHAGRLIGELYVVTGDIAIAEDLVAEAFTRAVKRWDRIQHYDEPVAWVRHVAFNLSRTQWRRTLRLRPLHDRPDRACRQTPPEDLVDLAAALAYLPMRQRQAVVLHYLLGYSVAETASVLGAPSGSVKAWLSRGRTTMRTALRQERCDD